MVPPQPPSDTRRPLDVPRRCSTPTGAVAACALLGCFALFGCSSEPGSDAAPASTAAPPGGESAGATYGGASSDAGADCAAPTDKPAKGEKASNGAVANAPTGDPDAGCDAQAPGPVSIGGGSDDGTLGPLTGTAYYVDPIAGSMSNPGTSASPWRTLEEVFAAGKKFVAGDRIYLRRGYHGGPSITGKNAGMVTIVAESGHAPVMKWVQFSGASFWTLQDVFINAQAATADAHGALIEFVSSSTDNVIRNVGAYSTEDPTGWAADEQAWLTNQKTGIEVKSGGNNRLVGVHVMNVGNGMIVSSTGNLIEHTTLENFTRDGWVPLGNNNTWQYNVMMNAIMTDHTLSIFDKPPKQERLHRDMVQTWNGAKVGMVFRGNTLISVADPTLPVAGNDPTTTGYIDKRIPAFAGWDGPFDQYTFENNVIFTDHQAGIWLNNATNSRIVNNTCTGITGASSTGYPAIKIIGASSRNLVYNNVANGFELPATALAGAAANVPAPSYGFFLAQAQPHADVHLKPTAAALIDKANDRFAPSLDADGRPRPPTLRDIGAYEYGSLAADTSPPTAPGVPRVVRVSGLGADLAWQASTDDRAVTGYDVYRDGKKVGRTRNGARFFDVTTGQRSASYTVQAFDASGNRSAMSAAASAP